jgi:biotin transport system permease protein
MAGKLTRPPFAYRSGNTVLHRAPAGLKLLFVIVLSLAAYTSHYGLVFVLLCIVVASAAARIRPHELLKGSKPVIVLSLCIIFFRTFDQGGQETVSEILFFGHTVSAGNIPFVNAAGFLEGVITALRIIASFSAAALLFAVTTMRELRRSLSAVELRLRGKKANIAFFSLGISLMLGFIPRFFDLWETSNIACEARSCRRGPRRLFILVPLITERMMEAAAETALALEARGMGVGWGVGNGE